MSTRAACLVLVFSWGLSACSRPISNNLGKNAIPTAILEDDRATGISSTLPLSILHNDSPTETSVATEVVQIRSEQAPSLNLILSEASSEAMPPYRVQAGSPRFMANFIKPEAGCNWMGVGGQAFNLNGQPVTRLVVEVGGRLAGLDVFHLELTGSQSDLGAGGYLITLSNKPVASSGTLWILLHDLGGLPLTNKIYFSTPQDCAGNFVLINFIEANSNAVPQAWLPMIGR